MISRTTLLVAAFATSSLLLLACSSDDGRPSEDTGGSTLGQSGEQGSSGSSGTSGTSGTSGSGTPAEADASATTPAPGTPSTPGTPGAKKALLEACMKDDECTSNVCYLGDQGSYCSLKCTAETASTVCVAPMAGTCNKKGFCKKP